MLALEGADGDPTGVAIESGTGPAIDAPPEFPCLDAIFVEFLTDVDGEVNELVLRGDDWVVLDSASICDVQLNGHPVSQSLAIFVNYSL